MKIKKTNLDPIKFFLRLNMEKNICFLTGSCRGWPTVIAFNPTEKFSYKIGETSSYKRFLNRNIKKGRKLIGYFSYDLGYELHNIKKTAKDDLQLPDIYFLAFDNYIVFKEDHAKIYYKDKNFPDLVSEINTRKPEKVPSVFSKNFKPETTKSRYEHAYKKIKQYIIDGDFYQINLTQRFKAQTRIPARTLFSKVIKTNPVDFLAYIEADQFEILSASPERFVKVKNRRIETRPIKGTRKRGRTAESDDRYRRELLANKKEAAELNMITDLLRNDLGKICETGSVKVTGKGLTQKCPSVWHTYSKITGRITDNINPVDAVVSMLPGGSITGCPKKHAMEIIDELEPTTRSVYTGIIGYINPDLEMDFNIAIRTIIKKNTNLYLQVGGGIVHKSRQKAEYQETLDKAESFMSILKKPKSY